MFTKTRHGCFRTLFAVVLALTAPHSAFADNIDQCFEIDTDRPRSSSPHGNTQMSNIPVRVSNRCSQTVYYAYAFCSDRRVFSHGASVDLYNYHTYSHAVGPGSPYAFEQAGGATLVRGEAYRFQTAYSFSPIPHNRRPQCPPPVEEERSETTQIDIVTRAAWSCTLRDMGNPILNFTIVATHQGGDRVTFTYRNVRELVDESVGQLSEGVQTFLTFDGREFSQRNRNGYTICQLQGERAMVCEAGAPGLRPAQTTCRR